MKNIYLLLFSLFTVLSFGQSKVNYKLIDKKMDAIPVSFANSTDSIAKYINANFKTENDKIRAAFYWTASNISYDVDNMFEVDVNQTPQERITKTLKTRKGICIDYANVFNEIAHTLGIKSVVVSGYTKINDRVSNLSHAWCAAKIDNKWYLFDPTWGSGYVNNTDKKYTRNINNSFFKIVPELMINSHMPFDYLWQFMNYPITNQEFMEGAVAGDEAKEKFDFIKEIDRLESLSKVVELTESSQRIQKNGMKNQLISQAYVNAINHLNYEKDKENRAKFNEANTKVNAIVKEYRGAIKELNDFVNYRNKQFQPLVSDQEIKRKIQEPIDVLVKCKEAISALENIGNQNKTNRDDLENNISKTLEQAQEHLQFVNLYLSKPKPVRKTMFYSVVRTRKS